MSAVIPGEEELGQQKRCGRCGEWWPLSAEFFFRDNSRKIAWTPWCRACWAERQREYRLRRRTTCDNGAVTRDGGVRAGPGFGDSTPRSRPLET